MQSKNLVVGQERPIPGEVDLRNLCWWENPVVRLVYVETAGSLKNVLTQMARSGGPAREVKDWKHTLILEADRCLKLQIILRERLIW